MRKELLALASQRFTQEKVGLMSKLVDNLKDGSLSNVRDTQKEIWALTADHKFLRNTIEENFPDESGKFSPVEN